MNDAHLHCPFCASLSIRVGPGGERAQRGLEELTKKIGKNGRLREP